MFRKRQDRATPVISTAPLSDIVFMLLFFFMVTSTIRLHTASVSVKLPNAQALEKRPDDKSVFYIFVGEATGTPTGALTVQVNNKNVEPGQIASLLQSERAKLPKYLQDKFTVSLKIHKDAKMKMVKQVKEQLKKAGAVNVDYSGTLVTN